MNLIDLAKNFLTSIYYLLAKIGFDIVVDTRTWVTEITRLNFQQSYSGYSTCRSRLGELLVSRTHLGFLLFEDRTKFINSYSRERTSQSMEVIQFIFSIHFIGGRGSAALLRRPGRAAPPGEHEPDLQRGRKGGSGERLRAYARSC